MYLNKQTIQLGVIIFAIIIVVLLGVGGNKNSRMAPLEVSFLNVGQGDAILINFLHSYQILIDGGPDGKKVLMELSEVMPFLDNKIEVVVVTHPDRDHFVGLIDILKKYEIGLILDNGQNFKGDIWREFQDLINKKGVLRQSIIEGSSMTINSNKDEYDVKFKFFNPDKVAIGKKEKNDSSIIGRMDYGESSFLFTGDAGFDAEADMIFDKEDVDVDFLKVGHHGSKYSTSDFFLARVLPTWSIISVGDNKYGHPTEEALNRLRKIGSKILRTDKLGTITIKCNKVCTAE